MFLSLMKNFSGKSEAFFRINDKYQFIVMCQVISIF